MCNTYPKTGTVTTTDSYSSKIHLCSIIYHMRLIWSYDHMIILDDNPIYTAPTFFQHIPETSVLILLFFCPKQKTLSRATKAVDSPRKRCINALPCSPVVDEKNFDGRHCTWSHWRDVAMLLWLWLAIWVPWGTTKMPQKNPVMSALPITGPTHPGLL